MNRAKVSPQRTVRATGPLGVPFQYHFFALSINKQLDLQSLGRILTYAGGWYEWLRTVQVYAIAGLIAALIFAFMGKESQRPRLG
jgi:hypothetical protein